jgi:hypothetical protein
MSDLNQPAFICKTTNNKAKNYTEKLQSLENLNIIVEKTVCVQT